MKKKKKKKKTFLRTPENRFEFPYKLPLLETICTKCQILFSGEYEKKYFNMLSSVSFNQYAKYLKINGKKRSEKVMV